MRIFLSHKNTPDNSYSQATNLNVLNGIVLDSEATEILCDDFISSFSNNEIKELLENICKKVRLKGQLIIKEVDANITARKYYVEEINLEELNSILFDNQKRKSIVDIGLLTRSIPESFQVEEKYFDNNTGNIVLKCRRVR